MEKGNLVLALKGKEKNQYFVVMNVENNFAYIIDGKRLKTINPKKKSMKHIQKASKNKFPVELFEVKNDNVNSAVRKFIKEEKEKLCQKMM
jgi:ribosomal protein L14E/L6E/L27E